MDLLRAAEHFDPDFSLVAEKEDLRQVTVEMILGEVPKGFHGYNADK